MSSLIGGSKNDNTFQKFDSNKNFANVFNVQTITPFKQNVDITYVDNNNSDTETNSSQMQIDEYFDLLKSYGINDIDINRVKNGEITLPELLKEIDKDPVRVRLIQENSFLKQINQNSEEQYDSYSDFVNTVNSEKEKLIKLVKERNNINDSYRENDSLQWLCNRLKQGEDLQYILESAACFKYKDEYGNDVYIYPDVNDGFLNYHNEIFDKKVEEVTFEEFLKDSELYKELKNTLSQEERWTLLGKREFTLYTGTSEQDAIFSKIETLYEENFNNRKQQLEEYDKNIETQKKHSDKLSCMKNYVDNQVDYYINNIHAYTSKDDFLSNSSYDRSNKQVLTKNIYEISKNEDYIVDFYSCLINGEIVEKNGVLKDKNGKYICDSSQLSIIDNMLDNYLKWEPFISDTEKNIFNYILNTEGTGKAYEYLESISNELDNRWLSNKCKNDKEFAQEHEVLASIGSIFLTPVEGINAFAYSINSKVTGEKIRRSDVYSKGNVWRQSVSEEIHEHNSAWGFIYDTGMSMADSGLLIATSAMTGGSASVLLSATLMGSRAYVSTLNDALDRGLSDNQAILLAASSAIVETAMESYSVGHLMNLEEKLGENTIKLTGKIARKINNPKIAGLAEKSFYILASSVSQGIAEGEEEFCTELLNYGLDIFISKDLSNYAQSLERYIAEGKSEEEAMLLTMKDFKSQLEQAFLGGFASGVCFGAFGGVNSTIKTSYGISHGMYNQFLGNNVSFSDALVFNQQQMENLQYATSETTRLSKSSEVNVAKNDLSSLTEEQINLLNNGTVEQQAGKAIASDIKTKIGKSDSDNDNVTENINRANSFDVSRSYTLEEISDLLQDSNYTILGHGTGGTNVNVISSILNNGLRYSHGSLMYTSIGLDTTNLSDLQSKLNNWQHQDSENIILMRLPNDYFNMRGESMDLDAERTGAFANEVIDENGKVTYYLDPKFIIGSYNKNTGEVTINPNFEENLSETSISELKEKYAMIDAKIDQRLSQLEEENDLISINEERSNENYIYEFDDVNDYTDFNDDDIDWEDSSNNDDNLLQSTNINQIENITSSVENVNTEQIVQTVQTENTKYSDDNVVIDGMSCHMIMPELLIESLNNKGLSNVFTNQNGIYVLNEVDANTKYEVLNTIANFVSNDVGQMVLDNEASLDAWSTGVGKDVTSRGNIAEFMFNQGKVEQANTMLTNLITKINDFRQDLVNGVEVDQVENIETLNVENLSKKLTSDEQYDLYKYIKDNNIQFDKIPEQLVAYPNIIKQIFINNPNIIYSFNSNDFSLYSSYINDLIFDGKIEGNINNVDFLVNYLSFLEKNGDDFTKYNLLRSLSKTDSSIDSIANFFIENNYQLNENSPDFLKNNKIFVLNAIEKGFRDFDILNFDSMNLSIEQQRYVLEIVQKDGINNEAIENLKISYFKKIASFSDNKWFLNNSSVDKVFAPSDITEMYLDKFFDVNEVNNLIENIKNGDNNIAKILVKLPRDKSIPTNSLESISDKNMVVFTSINNVTEFTVDDLINTNNILDLSVADIKNSDLSPYEKYVAVYNIVRSFKTYDYYLGDENIDHDFADQSRDIYLILNNDYIVCAGYANLLNELLNRVGIHSVYSSVYTSEPHARNYVYINDSKYGINGYFMCDPTADKIQEYGMNPLSTKPKMMNNTADYYKYSNDKYTEIFKERTNEELFEYISNPIFTVSVKQQLEGIDPDFYAQIEDRFDNIDLKLAEDINNHLKSKLNNNITEEQMLQAFYEVSQFVDGKYTGQQAIDKWNDLVFELTIKPEKYYKGDYQKLIDATSNISLMTYFNSSNNQAYKSGFDKYMNENIYGSTVFQHLDINEENSHIFLNMELKNQADIYKKLTNAGYKVHDLGYQLVVELGYGKSSDIAVSDFFQKIQKIEQAIINTNDVSNTHISKLLSALNLNNILTQTNNTISIGSTTLDFGPVADTLRTELKKLGITSENISNLTVEQTSDLYDMLTFYSTRINGVEYVFDEVSNLRDTYQMKVSELSSDAIVDKINLFYQYMVDLSNLIIQNNNLNVEITEVINDKVLPSSSVNKIDYSFSLEEKKIIIDILQKTNNLQDLSILNDLDYSDKVILQKYLQSGAAKTLLNLNLDQFNALYLYMSGQYKAINSYLDTGIDVNLGFGIKASEAVKLIDEVMFNNTVEETCILQRAASDKDFEGVSLNDLSGKILIHNRNRSCSANSVDTIGTEKGGVPIATSLDEQQVKIDYICPKGTKMVNLGMITSNDVENEVTLGRNQRIRYDAVKMDGDTACVLAVVLPDGVADNVDIKTLVDTETYDLISSRYDLSDNNEVLKTLNIEQDIEMPKLAETDLDESNIEINDKYVLDINDYQGTMDTVKKLNETVLSECKLSETFISSILKHGQDITKQIVVNKIKEVVSLLEIPGFVEGLSVFNSYQRDNIDNINFSITLLPMFNSQLIEVNNILNDEKFSNIDGMNELRDSLQSYLEQYSKDSDFNELQSNLSFVSDSLFKIVSVSDFEIADYQLSNIEKTLNSDITGLPSFVLEEIQKYNDYKSYVTEILLDKDTSEATSVLLPYMVENNLLSTKQFIESIDFKVLNKILNLEQMGLSNQFQTQNYFNALTNLYNSIQNRTDISESQSYIQQWNEFILKEEALSQLVGSINQKYLNARNDIHMNEYIIKALISNNYLTFDEFFESNLGKLINRKFVNYFTKDTLIEHIMNFSNDGTLDNGVANFVDYYLSISNLNENFLNNSGINDYSNMLLELSGYGFNQNAVNEHFVKENEKRAKRGETVSPKFAQEFSDSDERLYKGFTPMSLDYFKLRHYLTHTLLPGLDNKTANRILSLVNEEGACSYVGVLNLLYLRFKNEPNVFREIFGVDLYKSSILDVFKDNTSKELNQDFILLKLFVDFNYDSINNNGLIYKDDNGKFMIKDKIYYRSTGELANDQFYFNPTTNYNLVEKYINKNTSKNYKVNTSLINANMREVGGDIIGNDVNSIKNNIIKALKDNKLVILGGGFQNKEKTIPQINILLEDGTINPLGGGHAMVVTGITSDGMVKISTWEKSAIIDLNELVNTQYRLSVVEINEVADTKINQVVLGENLSENLTQLKEGFSNVFGFNTKINNLLQNIINNESNYDKRILNGLINDLKLTLDNIDQINVTGGIINNINGWNQLNQQYNDLLSVVYSSSYSDALSNDLKNLYAQIDSMLNNGDWQQASTVLNTFNQKFEVKNLDAINDIITLCYNKNNNELIELLEQVYNYGNLLFYKDKIENYESVKQLLNVINNIDMRAKKIVLDNKIEKGEDISEVLDSLLNRIRRGML